MTAETITATTPSAAIHPGWVRVRHWINAIAILVLIRSGRQIYDASPQLLSPSRVHCRAPTASR